MMQKNVEVDRSILALKDLGERFDADAEGEHIKYVITKLAD